MKNITLLLLFAFVIGLAPVPAQALSCLDPRGMIENFATEPTYTIFTANPGKTVEHTKETASEPFMQDSGYTGQYVEVSEVHKGMMDSKAWVYFQKDSTWGYLCTNQPPKTGEVSVYIINNDNSATSLPQVVNVFSLNDEIAMELLEKLANDNEEGYLNEQTPQTIKQRVADSLRELIFIARIKLAEWRFWGSL